MVWRRDAAEDAPQEILLKAVTHPGTFAGRSKFSTWLYRIAVNHLLNVRKSEMEEQRMTFADMGRSLDACADSELPDESLLPMGHELLVEEAKLGCVTAMLMCLDRRQRLAFILGEIFGLPGEQGGEVMEISAMSIPALDIRAANARVVSAPSADMALESARGVICHERPQRTLHQPHAVSVPP